MSKTSSFSALPRAWLVLVILLLAAGTWVWLLGSDPAEAVQYRSTKVARGTITASVSATGTLNPVTSVQVGSQVSGQIREILVDYNSVVREGQLLARIDPQTFESRVRQAQADLEAARAQVLTAKAGISAARAGLSRAQLNHADAKRDLDRKQQLIDRAFISPAELDKARVAFNASGEDVKAAGAQLEVAQAQAGSTEAVVRQRQAQLAQAQIDLERTAIRAPVNGVVIKRSVDTGQTVAATLQSPELFVLARDLKDMQVDTSIDEAEVGKIREGQQASFTVDAFPGRSFSGDVLQVRKSATTVQNVVTYIVVVSARNPDLALVPGMTANVRIVTETRESVLKVPNAAMRFRPPDFREPGGAQGAGAGNQAASTGQTGSPQPGGTLVRLRESLITELKLNAEQQQQLDEILASMRGQFLALRNAAPAERARLSERNRGELRERINAMLSPEQRSRYAELIARTAGKRSSTGRVFVLDETGQARPVTVRVGASDGSFTEVSGKEISEGSLVITGIMRSNTGKTTGPRNAGPRLPF
jgi:HlyD family secretion protein